MALLVRPQCFERVQGALGGLWSWAWARDFGFTVGVILVYFLLRGLAGWDHDFAVRVTTHLIDFERATGTYWEPHIQEWSIRYGWMKEFVNFVYAYLHFPVLIVVGAWLYTRGVCRFVFMRNVMFLSMVFGLLFYYFLPAAPPRLMERHGYDLGFVDTIFGTDTHVSYAQPSIILNEYAAIPSFHFGWIALASAAIWINSRNVVLRAVAVLLSLVMGWAIIASANHFWVDMAAGVAVVALCWWLAAVCERRGWLQFSFAAPHQRQQACADSARD